MKWRDERRSLAEKRAANFKENPQMERLAQMKKDQPDRYDRVDPQLKMALGFYLSSKEAAEEVNR